MNSSAFSIPFLINDLHERDFHQAGLLKSMVLSPSLQEVGIKAKARD
jgi:hypothetical protein